MRIRTLIFVVAGGLIFTVSGMRDGHFGWWLAAGILIAASLVPVARFGPRHPVAQFGAMAAALVVVGIWCTTSEGALFFPERRAEMLQGLVGGTVMFTIAAAWLAVLARLLRLTEEREHRVEGRAPWAIAPLILAAGIAYLVYYEVFGAATFLLYTKQFYPHAAEQVAALGPWFPLYQVGRGVLMTLAVLPLVYTLRLKRWQAAVLVGLVVWLVGGGATLLVPNPLMAPAQRYAHIIEIMTQNFSLGMTAVWLLRRKAAVAVAAKEPVAVG